MPPIRMSAFDLHRERVEGMAAEGKSLARVERAIERAALPVEHRDALWLLAWSLERRRGSDAGLGRPELRPAETLVPAGSEL